MKRRKLGVKIGLVSASGSSYAIPAQNGVELFDVETGEAIEGVRALSLHYDVNNAIVAHIELFVTVIKAKDDSNPEPGSYIVTDNRAEDA